LSAAHQYARKHRLSFWQALWATRAGNVFTTHTPVAAGFDAFPSRLLRTYLPYVESDLTRNGTSLESLIGLGRVDPSNAEEAFNMAWLAQRGFRRLSGREPSARRIQPPYLSTAVPALARLRNPDCSRHERRPRATWDSAEADRIWTDACGRRTLAWHARGSWGEDHKDFR